MARNEEKAQSMLYRFREAQAAELGLGTRADRRPKMASACKSLRECERWRGEILREISRKVSKIQDAGLSDYEVRDLNDEINKLIREKRHWENQIVALGGANYRRNVAMLDDDGKEVPGTKGYKYFGRAKDLPGVRELFQSRKKDEEEENQVFAFYKKFTNRGAVYYGDVDDDDDSLTMSEREAEEEAWREFYTNLCGALNLPTPDPVPKLQRIVPWSHTPAQSLAPDEHSTSRTGGDVEDPGPSTSSSSQAPKTDSTPSANPPKAQPSASLQEPLPFFTFLRPEELMPPKMPTREETDKVLLELRKKALLEEYFGNDST